MDATMELSKVRQGWSEIEALETQVLRRLTVEAGIRQYLALQAEFEPQLLASEPCFRQQRNDALAAATPWPGVIAVYRIRVLDAATRETAPHSWGRLFFATTTSPPARTC
jgi:hypothetical protein